MLFFYKKRWSLILLQLMAYGAVAIWLEAAIRLVEFRQQMGQLWAIAAIILGAVAVFTLASGLLLNSHSIAHRYSA